MVMKIGIVLKLHKMKKLRLICMNILFTEAYHVLSTMNMCFCIICIKKNICFNICLVLFLLVRIKIECIGIILSKYQLITTSSNNHEIVLFFKYTIIFIFGGHLWSCDLS